MSNLKYVVELYRMSKTPTFDGVSFSASIAFTPELKKTILKMFTPTFNEGSFDEIEVDGNYIYDTEDLPDSGSMLCYTFKVARRSAERFYTSLSDFITINTLKKGVMPRNFYIAELDYYSSDAIKPIDIVKIEKICLLISYLSKIAHFHDMKSDTNVDFYRLVFVLHSESKSTTAVIETNLSEDMLHAPEISINLISNLSQSDASKDNHYLEKINTFRNTLIEYSKNNSNTFSGIVKNWDEIISLYSNNLAVYMSGFSFHKSRKEVADAEIDYADKISKVVTEVTSKALAIPISLVAAISVFQMSESVVIWVTVIGVFLTSIITSLVAISQKHQLRRIIHAKDTLFSSMFDRFESEQNELKTRLNVATQELRKNEIFCTRTLDLMLCLSWMPTSVGIIALLLKL